MRFTQTSLVFGILASLLTAQSFSTLVNAEKSKLHSRMTIHQTLAPEHPFVAQLEQSLPRISDVQFYSYNLNWIQGQVDGAVSATIPRTAVRAQAAVNFDKTFYNPNDTAFIEVSLVNPQTKLPVAVSAADQQN